ncbi:immunoglobulin domain-containing protein [Brevifollis gellanilyticus]|uniref:Ig-like domain-containing protein n=1 Tax=Brevifollis gellanilyticus TaxID=748831 RepID=A0A512M684_9BACT|nr:immunoglobulin domain-containing protein [Brevifollis gellanilyticus]GEP42239.1 hypothetical protein BGE01nite_15300 [Brevifollis gellanilyticus]
MFARLLRSWFCTLAILPSLNSMATEVTLDSAHFVTTVGQPIMLTVNDPSDDGTLRYEWWKDGKVIPSQRGSSLEIRVGRPLHAGNYQARVIGPNGVSGFSPKTPVVILESQDAKQITISSPSLTMEPAFWGPVDRIYWTSQSPPFQREVLKDCWWARGTQTSRLRILSYFMLRGNVDCIGIVGGEEILLGSFVFEYDFSRPFARASFHYAPWDIEANVGEEIGQATLQTDGGMLEVSGMPPGVTASDGMLSGTPTKAGNYQLQWKLLDMDGRVMDTSQSRIFVKDPEKPAVAVIPGLWAGQVTGFTNDIPVRGVSAGMIELQASAQGTFSGLLRLGHRRWPLAGTLRWDGEAFRCRMALAPPAGLKRLVCIVNCFAGGPYLDVTFEVEFTHPEILGEHAEDWNLVGGLEVPRAPDSADVLRPSGMGRITALMPVDPTEDGYAVGTGYMSAVPVQKLQRVDVAGMLPDGSGITGSMPVVSGQPFSVVFYSPLRQDGENLLGQLEMVGVPWYSEDRPVLSGILNWLRIPVPGKGWLAGTLKEWVVNVSGELYFRPETGPLLPSTLPGTEAFIQLNGGSAFADLIVADHLPFDLLPNDRAVFPKPDPRSFKIDIYAATGFFTGSFKLFDGGEDTSTKSQTVSFRGMMAPGLSRGGGYFHFKAPASFPGGSSAFYSGALDIFRPDDKLIFGPPAPAQPHKR